MTTPNAHWAVRRIRGGKEAIMANRALRGSLAAAGAAVVGVGLVAAPAAAAGTTSNTANGCTANVSTTLTNAGGNVSGTGWGGCGTSGVTVQVQIAFIDTCYLGPTGEPPNPSDWNWQPALETHTKGQQLTASFPTPTPGPGVFRQYKVRTRVWKGSSATGTPNVSVASQVACISENTSK
jgi:hypothetical protein